jgi:hypothetical protein
MALFAVLAGAVLPLQLHAEPLYSKNLAPVSGLFGFPVMRNAQVLEQAQFSVLLQGNIANDYSVDRSGSEFVNFDGETDRLAGRFAYGLGRGWELEGELAWMRHYGGELDRWIEDWHDLWGLPDGNRDEVPRDMINFSYKGPGASFAMLDDVDGAGDAHLAVVKRLWQSPTAAISARAGVKFGLGEEEDLLGSGSDDYYLSFNFSGQDKSARPLTWHGQFGYLRAGDAEVLGSIQEQDLWFAGLGLEWQTWQQVHLKLQVDSHDAVADSDLDQLGDVAVQLSAGVGWLFAPGWELEFSFSEDIAVDTAPDFVIGLGLRYRSSAP